MKICEHCWDNQLCRTCREAVGKARKRQRAATQLIKKLGTVIANVPAGFPFQMAWPIHQANLKDEIAAFFKGHG